MSFALVPLLFALAAAQLQDMEIGIIDFYALGDLKPEGLRAALTVRPGDRLQWPGTRDRIRTELTKAAGRPFTNFSPVCCDGHGRLMLYIGFGARSTAANYRPSPGEDVRLAPDLTALYDEFIAALPEALQASAARAEDRSDGYALSPHLRMREIQLRMRAAALRHETSLLRVLARAAEDRQRIAAAHLAGYTRQSAEQIAALMEAARDSNETVRNNATRALAVLAANPKVARKIPGASFIEKLNSPAWSDRNKGLMLLTLLTRERDPELLAKIRAEALPALVEMAVWQNPAHAEGPIRILGRIAGLDEKALDQLVGGGDIRPLLAAIEKLP
jgi:hypothetical protein